MDADAFADRINSGGSIPSVASSDLREAWRSVSQLQESVWRDNSDFRAAGELLPGFSGDVLLEASRSDAELLAIGIRIAVFAALLRERHLEEVAQRPLSEEFLLDVIGAMPLFGADLETPDALLRRFGEFIRRNR